MSYAVHFSFSLGLSVPLTVPKGTKQSLIDHVAEVERVLELKRIKPYSQHDRDAGHADHWDSFGREKAWADIDDELLCKTVQHHNAWVVETYKWFGIWAKEPFSVPVKRTNENCLYWYVTEVETITPEDAREFWPGFTTLDVPVERWSRDYYQNRMEHLYEVMRGRPQEGVTFDAKALTEQQAGAVINLFSEYIDLHDIRLEVVQSPGRGFNGQDRIASSHDGGYTWCDGCFKPIDYDCIGECKKRGCPLLKEASE
jgi:hypothetical protein